MVDCLSSGYSSYMKVVSPQSARLAVARRAFYSAIILILIGTASCASSGTTSPASGQTGSGMSSASSEPSQSCGGEEMPGLIVKDCTITSDSIRRSLLEGLEQSYPGRYTREELACIGDYYQALSRPERAAIVAAVLNSQSSAASQADSAIERIFTSCDTVGPSTP